MYAQYISRSTETSLDDVVSFICKKGNESPQTFTLHTSPSVNHVYLASVDLPMSMTNISCSSKQWPYMACYGVHTPPCLKKNIVG